MSNQEKDVLNLTSPDGGLVKITLGEFPASEIDRLKKSMEEAGWEIISQEVVTKRNPYSLGSMLFLGLILGIVLQSLVTTIFLSW